MTRRVAIVWRRRWYVARPWVLYGIAGLGLIAAMVAGFELLDICARLCLAWGYCA